MKKRIFILLPVLAALAAGFLYVQANYIFAGRLYPKNAEALDLRERDLTAAKYEQLREKLPGCSIRWSVPVFGTKADSAAESLTAGSLTAEDISALAYFPGLRKLDVSACSDVQTVSLLLASRPDLEIHRAVVSDGRTYDENSTEAVLPGSLGEAELEEFLRLCPGITRVTMDPCAYDIPLRLRLMEAHPDISFEWPVSLLGTDFNSTDEFIRFDGCETWGSNDFHALMEAVPLLKNAGTIDLRGCSLRQDELLQFCDALKGTDVIFSFRWFGIPTDTDAEEVDLSGIAMQDTGGVEGMLPYMTKLKKVIMSDCGLDNETMDALNRRHEDIRFIWTICFDLYSLRTDAIGFRGTEEKNGNLTGTNLRLLKYCPDLIALDIGHKVPSDLSFLYDMPQLKYLIACAGRGKVTDITPIGSLKNLIWLEIFLSAIPDISAVQGCTALCDLNIMCCALESSQATYETILAMPWLERVWFSDLELEDWQEQKLQEAMPNTEFFKGYDKTWCTMGTWRYNMHYYEMRDALNIFYMAGDGGSVPYRILDGVRYYQDDAGEWVPYHYDDRSGKWVPDDQT